MGGRRPRKTYDQVISAVMIMFTMMQVMDQVQIERENGAKFKHITTGEMLDEWDYEPLFAQCYLGGMGIADAFRSGADIVICGRVADAAPIVGSAAWFHNWSRTDFDYLARCKYSLSTKDTTRP